MKLSGELPLVADSTCLTGDPSKGSTGEGTRRDNRRQENYQVANLPLAVNRRDDRFQRRYQKICNFVNAWDMSSGSTSM